MKGKKMMVSLLTLMALCFGTLGFGSFAIADDTSDPLIELTVNINEADAVTLADMLDGVGLSRAEAIVAYREAHGKFYSAEELTAVRGIGKATVARNETRITVE